MSGLSEPGRFFHKNRRNFPSGVVKKSFFATNHPKQREKRTNNLYRFATKVLTYGTIIQRERLCEFPVFRTDRNFLPPERSERCPDANQSQESQWEQTNLQESRHPESNAGWMDRTMPRPSSRRPDNIETSESNEYFEQYKNEGRGHPDPVNAWSDFSPYGRFAGCLALKNRDILSRNIPN